MIQKGYGGKNCRYCPDLSFAGLAAGAMLAKGVGFVEGMAGEAKAEEGEGYDRPGVCFAKDDGRKRS